MASVAANYTSPCPYVPLNAYDWSLLFFRSPDPACSLLPWNPAVYSVVATLFGISIWAALELQLQLFITFKRWSSLYFWSILVSSWGCIIITIGYILRLFSHVTTAVLQGIIATGWVMMTSGFALVLYSRLYLIASGSKVLKAVFWMIIFDGVAFHTPIIVSGALPRPDGVKLFKVTSHMEIIFAVQEIVISTLYVYLFTSFMKHSTSKQKLRSTLYLLLLAELLSLVCDVVTITLLYEKLFLARIPLESLSYVIKLKIEFAVLNRLTQLVKHNANLQPPPVSMFVPEDIRPGRHALFQGFTETFSPAVSPVGTSSAPVHNEPSPQYSGHFSKSSGKLLSKTPTFITRSSTVDEEPVDLISQQVTSDSIVALERHYLGRFV